VFDLETPYVRAEPSRAGKRTINKRSYVLETLDACWGVCQVRVAQWLRLTAKRRSAT
jgi:hypothetical protein